MGCLVSNDVVGIEGDSTEGVQCSVGFNVVDSVEVFGGWCFGGVWCVLVLCLWVCHGVFLCGVGASIRGWLFHIYSTLPTVGAFS